MRILPVLDIQKGIVVRAVAGRRHEYRPLQSQLTPSCRPAEVARTFREQLGLSELYVADLDALSGESPSVALYTELHAAGDRLWVDAGLREAADALPLVAAGVEVIIAGLETMRGPIVLAELVRVFGPARSVFSLDLKANVPLGDRVLWRGTDAFAIAEEAVAAGVQRILVLDLARVGVGQGVGTEGLCGQLTKAFPDVDVAAGGGVRDLEDVRRLQQAGVRTVLVASALHDGRLGREQIEQLTRS